ncbi:hypothetical protein TCAL_00653 [Tigriopus californicus]|uniref:Reticulocalbin-3 n=1 Tax=Tigriopus californicus TaxID=6832 RepID=A0A553PAW4_TIGCA|nr:reticulocalbin-2-like [Tigriopus californicus]TRY74789.1 hypothetical protein TCAL_00653 [Tigriopus californicus]|eukprot:TCALIF_00653-PA protein Name:"Similar to Reticulocalbin-2 (Crotalus adamanteus)" AED:0.01 eAED:0.01 QI:0/-1/0/1/-1/1/1/0/351
MDLRACRRGPSGLAWSAWSTWLIWLTLGGSIQAGVPQKHAGHNHARGGQAERTADGAFASLNTGEAPTHENAFDHEAILGSHAEAETFDQLSPAEAQRRLRILLDKMDRNHDERIEKPELFAWILRSFKSLSQEESSERFKDADLDADGEVTWAEYIKEEFEIDDDEEGQAEMKSIQTDPDRLDELQMMEEDRILFQAADKNGDNKLTPPEFLSFSHPEDDPSMHQVVLQQVLHDKDRNRDGRIDFQEYIGERGQDQSKEWIISEKDRFDNELDKDKDGTLSAEEIKAWMIPSNNDIAHDEVSHLFAGADDDVDGMLTFDEILTHHDIFVGSEATDYGEHLNNLHKFEDEL